MSKHRETSKSGNYSSISSANFTNMTDTDGSVHNLNKIYKNRRDASRNELIIKVKSKKGSRNKRQDFIVDSHDIIQEPYK